MKIRIRQTGAVVNSDEFRSIYPNTSFPSVLTPEILDEFGADTVLERPQPTLSDDQYYVYTGVTQDTNGNWMTTYEARDYTEEELAARLEQWRQSASCTPFQGRMALADAGLLATVQSAVDDADEKTRVAWEYALLWQRTSPMIAALAGALQMTDAQIDDLFKAAAQISA